RARSRRARDRGAFAVTAVREWPGGLVAVARIVNAIFFLAAAAFCLLSYSPFAYGQFIKPSVVPALTDFVTLSPWLFLVALLITMLTVMPELRGAADRRCAALARGYVAVAAIVGAWMFATRPLLTLGNGARGLALALAALVWPIGLAVIDHRARSASAPAPTDRSRLVSAGLVSAVVAWLLYAIAVYWRLGQAVGIDLPRRALAIGLGTSLVFDLFAFAAIVLALLALAGAAGLWRRPGMAEYWLFVGLLGLCTSLVFALLVSASIAFTGWDAWLASLAMGAATAIVWADVARLRASTTTASYDSLELFCAPIAGIRSGAWQLAIVVALPFVSYALVDAVSHFDWNFLLQKLGVLLVWLIVFAVCGAALQRRQKNAESSEHAERTSYHALPASSANAAFYLVPLLIIFVFYRGVVWIEARPVADARLNPRVVLDRYTAVDPSFRLIRDAQTARSAETAEYYAYLQANTLILPATVQTPETPFVDAFATPTTIRKPDIYLFVIDSMRRDYVSPYNPAANFTPEIAKLGQDSYVFDRAFTRYAGTALAVPSIWAGGMVIHTLEQPAFGRRDTLLKLLDADGYVRLMDLDHVIDELVPRDPNLIPLDRGKTTMQFDVCTTVNELEERVTENADRRPVFFYSLPQNVHISIASHRKVPDGESYPGFFAPVASAVRRVDGCLGGFVDFLKRTNRYDNSIIIVTSDHGDSLGEEGRWGHAYFIFPEVMRIPLIVHLPSRMRATRAVDVAALTFSTDLAPSLYALLGHEPRDRGSLFGRPLFVPPDADVSWRRREPFLL
ncbi:MAG TPA: sulfatase-like hydrolase/transferase, partial [Vicinamibacterales bacterium]|nr:sulfatase-like hydrolase/transferase [Vicinamibacterales bacterium]